jgi:hypothetical protein
MNVDATPHDAMVKSCLLRRGVCGGWWDGWDGMEVRRRTEGMAATTLC